MGNYQLLFHIDNAELYTGSFAIDNISITSCDYPPTTFVDEGSLLSFSCDFDDQTMCLMSNGNRITPVNYNFSVFTGYTVPNQDLGPLRDHTNDSMSGGFLYWNRTLPFTVGDYGLIQHSRPVEANGAMCLHFAFFVNSSISNQNATTIGVGVSGCIGASLWSQSLDDSQGWQVVTIPVPKNPCRQTFSLSVGQSQTVPVSVAFDDIEVVQCTTLPPNTTTTSTTTTTTTTTVSTDTTSTTTTTTMITTSTTSSTITITTTTTVTTFTQSSTTSSLNGSSRNGFFFSGSFSFMILLCYTAQKIFL